MAGALIGTELPGGLSSFIRSPCPTRSSREGASKCCLNCQSVCCPGLSCRYVKWWVWVFPRHVTMNKPCLCDSNCADAVWSEQGCRGWCVGCKNVEEPTNWCPPYQAESLVLVKKQCLFSPEAVFCVILPVPWSLIKEIWSDSGFTALMFDFSTVGQVRKMGWVLTKSYRIQIYQGNDK